MQAKTLKERKAKKPVKTIKNLLCSSDLRWPVLDSKQEEKLLALICGYKTDTKLVKKLPWSQLKNIPKQERPKVNYVSKHPVFSFGISECSRLLKNKKCKLILIDADVTPRILVSHIIDNAINKLVPVFCVSRLKSVLYETFHFKSICIAIKQHSTHDVAQDLINFVTKISNNIDKTKHDIIQKTQEEMKFKEAANDEIKVCQLSIKTGNSAVKDIVEDGSNIYLRRSDKSIRIFIPSKDQLMETSNENAKFGDTFIEVSECKNITKISQKPSDNYKGMHLKRIQNNSNRKRKLQETNWKAAAIQ